MKGCDRSALRLISREMFHHGDQLLVEGIIPTQHRRQEVLDGSSIRRGNDGQASRLVSRFRACGNDSIEQ